MTESSFSPHGHELTANESSLPDSHTLIEGEKLPLPTEATLPAIPGYDLLGELGKGGMGVVYKARQHGLKRLVALKMIRTGPHASADEVARFRAEAEAVARLEHPHVVQIHEIGDYHGLPYLCLELVEGGSLADKLRDGPQPPAKAAELVETLARAIDVAHRRSIIHRDLKPGNVLLTPDGRPKITDFGLAKSLLEDATLRTAPDVILGTPSYMAPEQIPGVGPAVGPPADVYALGAILYECLTGRPPFYGISVLETLDQVRHQEPVPPARLQPRVPIDLDTICLKCLEKDPARRYASAAELADDLRRFQVGEPIRARPVGPVERLQRWCRRYPVVAGLLALAVALLLAGTGFSSFFAVEAGRRAKEAEDTATRLAEEKDYANQQRHRALSHLYVAHMNQGHQAWKDGQTRAMLDLLEGQTPDRTAGHDFRHFEWYYLRHLAETGHRVLAAPHNGVNCLATCPERDIVAAGTSGGREGPGDAELTLWDVGTGQALRSFGGPSRVFLAAALSPDGSRLASLGVHQGPGLELRVWDTDNGTQLLSLPLKGSQGYGLTFSPGGKYLAACDGYSIRVWDTATWAERGSPFAKLDARAFALAFTPDGAKLVIGVGAGVETRTPNLLVWDVAAGRQDFGLVHPESVLAVAVSPDGRWLATAGSDFLVRVWDFKARTQRWTLRCHSAFATALAFTRDSKRLLSAARDGVIRVWDLATGVPERDYRGHVAGVVGAAFGPGDRWLVSACGEAAVWIWDPHADQEGRSRRLPLFPALALGFSPDGRRLAVGRVGINGLAVLAADTGQPVTYLGDGFAHGGTSAVVYDPGGRRLLRVGKGWDLWDPANRSRLAGEAIGNNRRAAAFRPDGREFVILDTDQITFYDAASGARLRAFPANGAGTCTVAYSPDGRRVALDGPHRTTVLWDAASGQVVRTFSAHRTPTLKVAFSPDGRRLLSVSAGAVRVWDVVAGEEVNAFAVSAGINEGSPWSHWAGDRIAFTRDGRRLAAADFSSTVRVWDVETGQQTLALAGPGGQVVGVAFSPDGRRLAASGIEGANPVNGIRGLVRFWDAPVPEANR